MKVILSVPNEGYSRDAPCPLNLISTLLLLSTYYVWFTLFFKNHLKREGPHVGFFVCVCVCVVFLFVCFCFFLDICAQTIFRPHACSLWQVIPHLTILFLALYICVVYEISDVRVLILLFHLQNYVNFYLVYIQGRQVINLKKKPRYNYKPILM